MAIDKDRKGLVMFEPDLTPGTEIQLMRRSMDFSYIRTRAQQLYDRLESRNPFLAIYIDCMGRAAQPLIAVLRKKKARKFKKCLVPGCHSLGCTLVSNWVMSPVNNRRLIGAGYCVYSVNPCNRFTVSIPVLYLMRRIQLLYCNAVTLCQKRANIQTK